MGLMRSALAHGSKRSAIEWFESEADQEQLVAFVACCVGTDGSHFAEHFAHRAASVLELRALKNLRDEAAAWLEHGLCELERADHELVASKLIGMTLSARLGRHVADDQVERASETLRIGFESVEYTNLCVGWQRETRVAEVDTENATARADLFSCVKCPGSGAGSEIEDALAFRKQTDAAVDLLQLVDRSSRVAFAPCATPVVILLAAAAQLALVGGFRSLWRGFLLDGALGKGDRRLLDGALQGKDPVAWARNAAFDQNDVLVR